MNEEEDADVSLWYECEDTFDQLMEEENAVAAGEASGVQKEQQRVRSNRGMGTLTLMLFIVLQEAEECI